MKRWLIMICLICLGGALFGAMLIQNRLVRSYEPPQWVKQLEFREEECAVFTAVIDSEILKNLVHGDLALVESYEIINRIHYGGGVVIPSGSEPSNVFQAAYADFTAQIQKSFVLTQQLKTRVPSRLVTSEESKARASHGKIAALHFSRVGFDEAMKHAVLSVIVDNGIARGAFVWLRKVDGRWIGHRAVGAWME